jgi:hypothetical protein
MADKKEIYTKEDFSVLFDRSRNLHLIEMKTDVEKPLPAALSETSYTRHDFARVAIENFVRSQKKV